MNNQTNNTISRQSHQVNNTITPQYTHYTKKYNKHNRNQQQVVHYGANHQLQQFYQMSSFDNNVAQFQQAIPHQTQQFNYQQQHQMVVVQNQYSQRNHQPATSINLYDFFMTNYYEQHEEKVMQNKRDTALAKLNKIIQEMIDQRDKQLRIARKASGGNGQNPQNLPPDGVTRFQLVQFGSTLLNAQDCESDIDLLLTTFDVYFDRLSFFNKIEQILRESSLVEDLLLIRSATVPLVKFQLMGVKMDLVFAQRPTPEFTIKQGLGTKTSEKPLWMNKEYLLFKDNDVLSSQNSAANSLNSYFTQLELKKCIKEFQDGLHIFSQVVRVVKFWAKRRGIYNYNLGYLNGISLSIMVVRAMEEAVDQFRMNAMPQQVVLTTQHVLQTFFWLYSRWNWQDYTRPVMIRASRELQEFCQENQILYEQHITQQASASCVPVLSPTYPFKCTTFQVNQCAREYISQQFAHASKCLSSIQEDPEQALLDLFASNSCMMTSSHFLRLEFRTLEEQPNQISDSGRLGHLKILGLIESRLKTFLSSLQQSLNAYKEILVLAESPVQGEDIIEQLDKPRRWLSSSFYITLPNDFQPDSQEMKQAVMISCIQFQERSLSNTIEIGGWSNHKAFYSIIDVEDLPGKLWNQQAQQMFKVPWMVDQQQSQLSDTIDTDCQNSLEGDCQQELVVKKKLESTYDLFCEFVNCN